MCIISTLTTEHSAVKNIHEMPNQTPTPHTTMQKWDNTQHTHTKKIQDKEKVAFGGKFQFIHKHVYTHSIFCFVATNTNNVFF